MAGEAFAAVLTPGGKGAIAVVRLWGVGAERVADVVFRPKRGKSLAATQEGKPRLGRAGAGDGDEVVAFKVPGSAGEVEIHCHGGPAAIALVLEALVGHGTEIRAPRDWIARAGRPRIEVEAEEDLAHAATLKVAEILLDQARGALSADLMRLARAPNAQAMAGGIAVLLGRAALGTRMVGGWTVALAGRPNVGKSSLMNALAGFDRAIVSPTPGTTRDVVTARTGIDGWPVELADTAGLREAADELEEAGVALARNRHGRADLVLVVLDRSRSLDQGEQTLLTDHPTGLVVANKCDLNPAWPGPDLGALEVSARTGEGIDRLVQEIGRRLVPEAPTEGSGVPFRAWQVERLERALALARGGRVESAATALARLAGRGGQSVS
jgi:tRNA modification GTPase